MLQAEPATPSSVGGERIITEQRLGVSFVLIGILLWLDPAIGPKYTRTTYCVSNSGKVFLSIWR
jgi:hypothetical protein